MDNKVKRKEIRLTQKEYDKLLQMAAASGRSVSEYIRAKLFGGEKATINAVEFLKVYKTQIYEMQKIGNNINQLAHYANVCIKSGMLSEAVVQEMNQTIGELKMCVTVCQVIGRRFFVSGKYGLSGYFRLAEHG